MQGSGVRWIFWERAHNSAVSIPGIRSWDGNTGGRGVGDVIRSGGGKKCVKINRGMGLFLKICMLGEKTM